MENSDLDSGYLKQLTVLYVEDNDEVREQLDKFLLRRAGTLVTAKDGVEGMEAFRAHQPQIVITDIMMPVMDGLSMSQEIRAIDKNVPIIVTTAFEQTDYLLRSINIGIDKYVTKPIDTDRLYTALLDCSRRLRAEELFRRQQKIEAEAQRIKHLETLGILAGGMAHDFNNLLQVILGYISLARMNAEPDSKVQEFLGMAEDGSMQARDLGLRLVTLANVNQAVFYPAQLEPLITATVNEALNSAGIAMEFDWAAMEKPVGPLIRRVFDFPEGLPPVRHDKMLLRQVIACLTINALEAMPDGGTVCVSASKRVFSEKDGQQLPPGDYLHVVFCDNGAGISPANLPKIFDPYFTTKDMGSKKGVGLSLALCQTIISKHGGLITAESAPGNGATFHIWLPVAEGAAL